MTHHWHISTHHYHIFTTLLAHPTCGSMTIWNKFYCVYTNNIMAHYWHIIGIVYRTSLAHLWYIIGIYWHIIGIVYRYIIGTSLTDHLHILAHHWHILAHHWHILAHH